MRLALALGLLLLISACDPCRRAQRTLARCPTAHADTTYLIRWDTLYSERHTTDTLINVRTLIDTVRIDSGRVRVRIVRRDSMLYVRAECLPDTVIKQGKDRIITVTKQAAVPSWLVWLVLAVLLSVALFGFLLIVRR